MKSLGTRSGYCWIYASRTSTLGRPALVFGSSAVWQWMLEPPEGSQYPQRSRYPQHPHPLHLPRMIQLIHQHIRDTQLQCRYPAGYELSVMFEAWQRRWVITFHVANKLQIATSGVVSPKKKISLNSARSVACAKIYVEATNLD